MDVKRTNQLYYEKRYVTTEKLELFKTELNEVDWNTVIENIDDANVAMKRFHELFAELYNKHFPIVKRKCPKKARKPWITDELLSMIKQRNALYSLKKRTGDTTLDGQIKLLMKSIVKINRIEHQRYINALLEQANGDMRKTWNVLNNILRRHKKPPMPTVLTIDNKELHSTDLANTFNNYFINAGAPDVRYNHVPYNPRYMPAPIAPSFSYNTVDCEIVLKVIDELRANSAAGYDDVSPRVIKHSASTFIATLTSIINMMIRKGIFPDCLKIARVIVVYKGGSKSVLANYRPISILSVFSKIFEKILFVPLYDFLEGNNILDQSQFGFRRGKSTEMAVIKIKEYILQSFQQHQYVLGIFIDYCKAFDSLDHEIILDKIKHYGVRTVALQLFRSYLSHRFQYVGIQNYASTRQEIVRGVPQGSNLGPLLFILYINDISRVYRDAQFSMFADDTNVFYSSNSLADIEQTGNMICANILDWSKYNKLRLNATKTKLVIFRAKNKPMTTINVVMDGVTLEIVDTVKFLGVTLDSGLTWKPHIISLCKKLRKSCGIAWKVNHLLNVKQKRMLYFSFFYSHIYYNLLSYGTAAPSLLQSIESLQRRFLRNFADSRNAQTTIFAQTSTVAFSNLYQYKLMRTLHYTNPAHSFYLPLCDLQVYVNNVYNLRQRDAYVLPFVRAEYSKQSLTYKAPEAYNKFEQKLINITTPYKIKKTMRELLEA
jgi:hypothetical protein